MAPTDEYTTASGGGGRLKLKGSKPGDGNRVDKKKKSKKKSKKSKETDTTDTATATSPSQLQEQDDEGEKDGGTGSGENDAATPDRESRGTSEAAAVGSSTVTVGKTDAERRYEEARKRRLNERLKREGVKTHKERVEELNRYLSSLSEHHDMPKIGPG